MSDMAKAAGMSPSTVNRFLRKPMHPKTSIPRTDTLLKISKYSGVPIFSGMEETALFLEKENPDPEVNESNAVGSPDPLGKSSPQVG